VRQGNEEPRAEAPVKQAKIARIFDRILEIGRDAAIVMIIFSMLAISARVVIRYTIGVPINWVVDVSTILQLYLTFLAAAWLLKEEGQISLDIVLAFLRPSRRFFLQIINSILGAAMCVIITVYGIRETWISWKLDLHLNMPMEPPKWTLFIVIPLGGFLLFIQFLRRTQGFLEKYRGCRLPKK
jgi:TRAP-type C4-dicarboxylate transport system permease small subunit